MFGRNRQILEGLRVIEFERCPAKTFQRDDGTTVLGRMVPEHCQIVGEVARALIVRYPTRLQNALFPVDAELAAACHDIGKVSPCFFEKLRQACTVPPEGLPVLAVNPAIERTWSGHAGVSQVAAAAEGAPQWVPEILGQHHGFSPQVAGKRADSEVFGGPPHAWGCFKSHEFVAVPCRVFPTRVGVFPHPKPWLT